MICRSCVRSLNSVSRWRWHARYAAITNIILSLQRMHSKVSVVQCVGNRRLEGNVCSRGLKHNMHSRTRTVVAKAYGATGQTGGLPCVSSVGREFCSTCWYAWYREAVLGPELPRRLYQELEITKTTAPGHVLFWIPPNPSASNSPSPYMHNHTHKQSKAMQDQQWLQGC